MEHFVEKLKDIESTFKEVEEKLSDPDVISDQETFKRLAKTRHQLQTTVDAFHQWQSVEKQISDAQEILRGESDKEMRELCELEVEQLKASYENLTEQLKLLLLPSDPNDEKKYHVGNPSRHRR